MTSMFSEVRVLWLVSWMIQLQVCKPLERMLFSQNQPTEGNRKSYSDALSSVAKQKYHLCLCLFDFSTCHADTANVSKVTTTDYCLWTAPINKTHSFKLSELRYSEANWAFFNFYAGPNMDYRHLLLYRFGPWNLITDFDMMEYCSRGHGLW